MATSPPDCPDPARTDATEASDKARRPQGLVSVVSHLVAYAVGRGISMADITDEVGVTRTQLLDPFCRVDDDVPARLWGLIARRTEGDLATLHMAGATGPAFFGPYLQGVRFAPTLEAALDSMERFGSVVADRIEIRRETVGDEVVMTCSHPQDELDGGRMAETGMAVAVRALTETFGFGDCIVRIEYSHAVHGPIEEYERFFKVPVLDRQPRTAVVFRADAMDTPSNASDQVLKEYGDAKLELLQEQLALPGAREEMASVFRAIAENAKDGEFGAEALARRLHTSLRALQRLARDNGHTVRRLLQEAREKSARELLVASSLNVDEIARRLGYSDSRAFRRAFRRWMGMTPTEYRSGHGLGSEAPARSDDAQA